MPKFATEAERQAFGLLYGQSYAAASGSTYVPGITGGTDKVVSATRQGVGDTFQLTGASGQSILGSFGGPVKQSYVDYMMNSGAWKLPAAGSSAATPQPTPQPTAAPAVAQSGGSGSTGTVDPYASVWGLAERLASGRTRPQSDDPAAVKEDASIQQQGTEAVYFANKGATRAKTILTDADDDTLNENVLNRKTLLGE